ncbi:uncharacterized protein M421DRAFT_426488 [Didymella exigua CBS 183.55]|uniref:LysM domain-containing protein n=1 Tax=Didymella exigua CBS 183.55 TaxID=1150837 RepID=A0A6A5R653_9PLEO|nr:uncharacterized protein M421DRAFT_426488 [Didymella exigua CBS 183.55]KAF1922869.1 hypothetical protein M421DRAFT_426488 [Didymella exigua CBS 183.55]
MKILLSLSLVVPPWLVAAYAVDPPSTAAPDTIADCTYWHIAAETETCSGITEYWGLTEAQFATYNPVLTESCDLIVGNSYCIEQNWGLPAPTPTSSAATSTSATSAPTTTPTPLTDLEICEAEAGGYDKYCERCLSRCATSAVKDHCFYSTFFVINSYDSDCWKHGGSDCANKAVDIVCPQK